MRKTTPRRGTAAYKLAKAQGRLPSKKTAKKADPVKKSPLKATVKQMMRILAAADKPASMKAAIEMRKKAQQKANRERNRQKGQRKRN
jgi:hypothetical protein